MSNELGPTRGQSYLGTKAQNPPNMWYRDHDPSTSDVNYSIGDFWLNTTPDPNTMNFNLWYLASFYRTITSKVSLANWILIGESQLAIDTINGDVGSMTGNIVTISGGTTGLTTSASGALMDIVGTLNVSHGGTGDTLFTAFAPITGGTTTTGSLQSASSGISNVGFVLTSTGASSLPTWQAAGAATSFNTINVQTFTSSGTYTPTANMQYCIIEVVGGGGGAGGVDASAAGTCGASSGGAGGGYSRGVFSAATIGASQAVTVGAGGTGGTGTSDGTAGGTSSVGVLISATGGAQGFHGAVAAAGLTLGGNTPGIGSGGQVNLAGNPGLNGWSQFISGTSFYLAEPGKGGGSVFGGGGGASGLGSVASGQEQGQNGSNYGGGGGGGVSIGGGTAITGGNGANGVVIITEYIS